MSCMLSPSLTIRGQGLGMPEDPLQQDETSTQRIPRQDLGMGRS